MWEAMLVQLSPSRQEVLPSWSLTRCAPLGKVICLGPRHPFVDGRQGLPAAAALDRGPGNSCDRPPFDSTDSSLGASTSPGAPADRVFDVFLIPLKTISFLGSH